jgi:hypothetical protein
VSQSSRPHRYVPALLALIVGLFVLVPFADALACGPEQAEATASVLLVNADADEAGDGCTPGQACSHGHCHAPVTLPPVALEGPHIWTTSMRLGAPPGHAATSTAPDGLIRPPRG